MGFEAFLGWDQNLWIFAILAVVFAGVVRGFTGFGFALVALGALSLFVEPKIIVPTVVILDMLASAHLIPRVWKLIEWRIIGWLTFGTLFGVPVGVAILAWLDADTMRIVISIGILVAVLLMWKGVGLTQRPGTVITAGTGVAAGIFSGSAGIPGPPVIILLLSSPIAVAAVRATTITFFILTDAIVLPNLWYNDLLNWTIFERAMVLVPAMLAGTLLGHRLFGIASPDLVKKLALVLLAILAVVGLTKVLLS